MYSFIIEFGEARNVSRESVTTKKHFLTFDSSEQLNAAILVKDLMVTIDEIIERIQDRIEDECNKQNDAEIVVNISLNPSCSMLLSLDRIENRSITKRNRGICSRAMQIIVNTAETHGIDLTLNVYPLNEGLSFANLIEWYGRFGFRIVKPDRDSVQMYRRSNGN